MSRLLYTGRGGKRLLDDQEILAWAGCRAKEISCCESRENGESLYFLFLLFKVSCATYT